ncbi:MAG: hypothetical protein WCQ77_13290 [Planctomycetota bacterium]
MAIFKDELAAKAVETLAIVESAVWNQTKLLKLLVAAYEDVAEDDQPVVMKAVPADVIGGAERKRMISASWRRGHGRLPLTIIAVPRHTCPRGMSPASQSADPVKNSPPMGLPQALPDC